MKKETNPDLLSQLFAQQFKRNTKSNVHYFEDVKDMKCASLLDILMLDNSYLTAGGQEVLNYLENQHIAANEYYTFENFKWKLMAFLSVQDLFDMPVLKGTDHNNCFQLRYFYYESKYLLLESVVSSLNGLHVANKQLLRNFLEFNLQQNYFTNVCKAAGSIYPLINLLNGSQPAPGNNILINKALPNDEFCKPIKKRIQVELQNLSTRYSHAYSPTDSPKKIGIFHPDSSIETLYFYLHLSIVLDIVLWMYAVNMPMLFTPVDILKKFGFSPPIGCFITKSTECILKKAFSVSDFELFKDYAQNQPETRDLLNFYNHQEDLTEEAIWATWQSKKSEKETLLSCWLRSVAEARGISESLAVIDKETKGISDSTIIDKMTEVSLNKYAQFSQWRKVYKKIK